METVKYKRDFPGTHLANTTHDDTKVVGFNRDDRGLHGRGPGVQSNRMGQTRAGGG